MKILVIKLGALGDVINTLPAVINIKHFFNAEIDWLVAPLSYPLIFRHPAVDNAIVFDKNNPGQNLPSIIQKLRKQEYSLILDFQRILKSAFFSFAAKGNRRIGFDRSRCKEFSWLLPAERIPAKKKKTHMLLQYMEFAAHVKAPTRPVRWDIPRNNENRYKLPRKYAVLNIGATKEANRWKPEYFAEVADGIHRELGLESVITGGKEDTENADTICGKSNTNILNLAGKTSISELVETVAESSCIVSADTGPMHLAVALGIKPVALFGPSDPERTGPFRGEVIHKPWVCPPCNRKSCPNPVCMDAIKPADVMERIKRIV